jgi:hypothetical protein
METQMTTNSDEYRAQLIAAAERILATERQKAAQETVKQMSDEQLMAVITTDLGLPAGTPLSDEQILMIANHKG